MQLVGASRPMVSIPFLLEGLFHGIVGGSLAAAAVWLTNRMISLWTQDKLNVPLPPFPWRDVLLVLAAAGAAYGVLCSAIALRFRQHA
jgi:cell division transport system permease protein